ncbi:MAG: hypothetical protein ACR2KU_05865 [Gammaproteobacteria bacterium]
MKSATTVTVCPSESDTVGVSTVPSTSSTIGRARRKGGNGILTRRQRQTHVSRDCAYGVKTGDLNSAANEVIRANIDIQRTLAA